MKVVKLSGPSVTDGVPQPCPFDLGESGRGRTLTRVQLSTAPGKQPVGPPPVGPEVPYAGSEYRDGRYVAASPEARAYEAYCARKSAAERWQWDVDYVVPARPQAGGTAFLLKAGTVRPAQSGTLVRLSTAGCYTKGSCGSYSVVYGDVSVIAEGSWAEGDAGRVAGGPDALLHVRGPAFLRVVLQGGESKGWGARCVVHTAAGRVWMGRTVDLAALITSDDRPDLTEVVRAVLADPEARPALTTPSGYDHDAACSCTPEQRAEYSPATACPYHHPAARLPQWYQTLLDAVAALEAIESAPADSTADVEHYAIYPITDWPALLSSLQPALTLPAGQVAPLGVDRVQAGCLVPGTQSMVFLATDSGGKRYRHSEIRTSGVTVVARGGEGHGYYSASESLLAIVDDPAFRVEWEELKDGVEVARVVATDAGVARNGEVTPWA